MTRPLAASLGAPFFEIGPKNLLRLPQLEELVRAAGRAGADFGVAVVLTAPTALLAPLAALRSGVRIYSQALDLDRPGSSFGAVTAESLVDAGADGVMLNHDARPLDSITLGRTVERAQENDLETILCAASEEEAVRFAELAPTAVLFEPPALIGTTGADPRPWIGSANRSVRAAHPDVLMMHAGGVASPEIARAIMTSGADGTGSTSGILSAADPISAARAFISATRAGWEAAQVNRLPVADRHRKGEAQ